MTSFVEPNLSFLSHVVDKDLQPVEATHFENKVIGLYFSAHWCGPCRGFTPKLAGKYEEIVKAGHGFEIVFVSSDEDEDTAHEYFATMPWKMIKFEEREFESSLSSLYKVRGIPTLVLLDADGSLLTTDGRTALFATPFEQLVDFVQQQEVEKKRKLEEVNRLKELFTFKSYFADKAVIGKDGAKVDATAWSDDTIVGLYFSAHWCPPCRMFTPQLAQKYQTLKDAGKPFEIIFVSSDRDEESAGQYFQEMPWHMLSFADRHSKAVLGEVFDVSGIPTLVLVDVNGLITDQGREVVAQFDFEHWRTFEEENKRKQAELEVKLLTMAEFITIADHEHPLQKLPSVYHGGYGCDGCGGQGQGWVYHCDICKFDMHPNCVLEALKAAEGTA